MAEVPKLGEPSDRTACQEEIGKYSSIIGNARCTASKTAWQITEGASQCAPRPQRPTDRHRRAATRRQRAVSRRYGPADRVGDRAEALIEAMRLPASDALLSGKRAGRNDAPAAFLRARHRLGDSRLRLDPGAGRCFGLKRTGERMLSAAQRHADDKICRVVCTRTL